jgi:hypothetical protein
MEVGVEESGVTHLIIGVVGDVQRLVLIENSKARRGSLIPVNRLLQVHCIAAKDPSRSLGGSEKPEDCNIAAGEALSLSWFSLPVMFIGIRRTFLPMPCDFIPEIFRLIGV